MELLILTKLVGNSKNKQNEKPLCRCLDQNLKYIIEHHRQSQKITYQTARTDLLKLAELELLIKQQIGKAFVFRVPKDLKLRIRNLTS